MHITRSLTMASFELSFESRLFIEVVQVGFDKKNDRNSKRIMRGKLLDRFMLKSSLFNLAVML